MRFNLRILFALMISIAAIPLLATAITFYGHEPSHRRELGIVTKSVDDCYMLASHGAVILAKLEDLNNSTRVYLQLRHMFRAPAIPSKHIDGVIAEVNDRPPSYRSRHLVLNEKWKDVTEGIHVRAYEIRAQLGPDGVRYPILWKPRVLEAAVNVNYVVLSDANSHAPRVVIAVRTEDGPFILTTVYDGLHVLKSVYRTPVFVATACNGENYSHSDAGAFFFNTLLVLSVSVLIAFLWALLRFHRRTKTPATPSPSCL